MAKFERGEVVNLKSDRGVKMTVKEIDGENVTVTHYNKKKDTFEDYTWHESLLEIPGPDIINVEW